MSNAERERRERRERLKRARRKLDEHAAPGDAEERPDRRGDPAGWDSLVERRIQEAMAVGAFDNLAGAGRPLNLARNPYLDPSLELAYGLLKNSGYTPEWIARDKEIREEIEALRARLRSASQGRHDQAAWQAALAAFEAALAQLNRKIDDFNLMAPVARGQRPRLRLEEELRRVQDE
jgi:DnaJ family protein C protein 28